MFARCNVHTYMYIHVHYIGLVNSQIKQKTIASEQNYDIPYYAYGIVHTIADVGVKILCSSENGQYHMVR